MSTRFYLVGFIILILASGALLGQTSKRPIDDPEIVLTPRKDGVANAETEYEWWVNEKLLEPGRTLRRSRCKVRSEFSGKVKSMTVDDNPATRVRIETGHGDLRLRLGKKERLQLRWKRNGVASGVCDGRLGNGPKQEKEIVVELTQIQGIHYELNGEATIGETLKIDLE